MSLQEQIELDLIQARKDKDAEKTGVLQLIKAGIEKAEIAKRDSLTEDEVLTVVKKEHKQGKESLEAAVVAGRKHLIHSYSDKLYMIEKYLPQQLTEDEILAILKVGGAQKGDNIGKLMGIVMKDYKSQVDGALVKKVISENF